VKPPEEMLGLRGAGGGLAKELFPERAGEAQGLEALLVELLESCVCFIDVGHGGSSGDLGVGVARDHRSLRSRGARYMSPCAADDDLHPSGGRRYDRGMRRRCR
jgi:hypothetical protein